MKTIFLTHLLSSFLHASAAGSNDYSSFSEFYSEPIAEQQKYRKPLIRHVAPSVFAETFQQLPKKTLFSMGSLEVIRFKELLRGHNIDMGEGRLLWRPMPMQPRFNLTTNRWEVRYFPYFLPPSSVLPSEME